MEAKDFLEKHGIPNMPTQYSQQFQTDVNDTIKALDAYHQHKLKEIQGTQESESKIIDVDTTQWVAVKDALPGNCDQVFVKYENGKYGINEWWESENCWKYEFDNMIVKEWCTPPR